MNYSDRYLRLKLNSAIRKALRRSDDLRKSKYQGDLNPFRGHCYVAAEAAYHILGGEKSDFKPCVMHVGEDTHWFLKNDKGQIFDPTWDQFETPPDYNLGTGKGFLTKEPSKRARELIDRTEKSWR